ncbi:MAG: c-type cytochrome [Pseudomonadota bacterium]
MHAILVSIFAAGGLALSGIAYASCESGKAALTTANCGTCHGILASDGSLVKGNAVVMPAGRGDGTGKSVSDWENTVNRMIDYGANTGAASVTDLAGYLAQSSNGVCARSAGTTGGTTGYPGEWDSGLGTTGGGDVDAGQGIFDANCVSCHGAGGVGGIGPAFVGSPIELADIVDTTINGRNAMPAFLGRLSYLQIMDVACYADSLGAYVFPACTGGATGGTSTTGGPASLPSACNTCHIMPMPTGTGGFSSPNPCIVDDAKLTLMAAMAGVSAADVLAARDPVCGGGSSSGGTTGSTAGGTTSGTAGGTTGGATGGKHHKHHKKHKWHDSEGDHRRHKRGRDWDYWH